MITALYRIPPEEFQMLEHGTNASIDMTPIDTETRAALRKIHHGLTYVLTFGTGWACGLITCAGAVLGWW